MTATAVNGEVADVGRDDFRFRVKFGKHHQRGVTGVHLWVLAEQGGRAGTVVRPNGKEVESSLRNHADQHQQSGPFLLQQVAGFTKNHFGSKHRFVERSDDACAPRVPLIANGQCADQRSGID